MTGRAGSFAATPRRGGTAGGTKPKAAGRTFGFTLLEAMLSLAAFLFVFTAGLGFIGETGRRFRDFQERTGDRQAVMAAVEKSRQDLQSAGESALRPLLVSNTAAAAASENRLTLRNGDGVFGAAGDLPAGATAIDLTGSGDFRAGRTVCVYDRERGEVREIAWVADRTIGLSAPLDNAYARTYVRVALLEIVEIYLDVGTRTLRRKVNGGSGQPLLEGVHLFRADAPASGGPVRLEVALESAPEIIYAISVFPKNAALALR